MEHLFVPADIAKDLDHLQFNERCFGFYNPEGELIFLSGDRGIKNDSMLGNACTAPLYQQVVDWFREKHKLILVVEYFKPSFREEFAWRGGYTEMTFLSTFFSGNQFLGQTYHMAFDHAIRAAIKHISSR